MFYSFLKLFYNFCVLWSRVSCKRMLEAISYCCKFIIVLQLMQCLGSLRSYWIGQAFNEWNSHEQLIRDCIFVLVAKCILLEIGCISFPFYSLYCYVMINKGTPNRVRLAWISFPHEWLMIHMSKFRDFFFLLRSPVRCQWFDTKLWYLIRLCS